MESRIHILPEHLASKIAAGEVVQRPASVVKELVENSIDSGANTITVIVKDAGKSFIQVFDDGSGMSETDARVAFERHSTSKIHTYEDLENIRTLGFRGEALASIAAVSHVEMHTRRGEDDVATVAHIEGGTIKSISRDSSPKGTAFTVRNLFYNTPGRRNFLKSDNTEFRHIYDVIQRTALSYPKMHIVFISDEEKVLDLRPSELKERIAELLGDRQSAGFIPFSEEAEVISVHGFVSKPELARKTRSDQYLFLNGRYIVSRSLNHAVFQAYEHLLEKRSFPLSIVYLTIDPHRVDVNVHPSKMEVKFEDERAVYRLIAASVRKALMANDLVPSVEMTTGSGSEGSDKLGFSKGSTEFPWLAPGRDSGVSQHRSDVSSGINIDPRQGTVDARKFLPKDLSTDEFSNAWQIHNKYIILPTSEGVMVIDQHAAHERVIYDRVIEKFDTRQAASQQLLFPRTEELSPGDAATVRQLIPYLEELGFLLKFFGNNTIVLEGIPPDIRPGKESSIFRDLIDLYKENEHDMKLDPRDNLAKSFSCRAAVMAGDPLRQEEIRALLNQLFATKVPFVCPHGRPAIVKLSLAELDRRFGRTS